MKRPFIAYLLCSVMLAAGCNAGKNTKSSNPDDPALSTGTRYSYSDGSGNSYVLTKDSFDYSPVKPAESSTGRYDGGAPVKNQPDPELFNKAGDLFRAAYADTKEHTTERGKGTGAVVIRDAATTYSFILKMGSVWITQIEALLTKMKGIK